MPVISANDDTVRDHIGSNSCVFVTYMSPSCHVCQSLMPSIQKLSIQPSYENIVFVEIDADENPVAKIEMQEKQLPFIVTYKDGLLIDCATVSTEYDILEKLKNLDC